MGLWIVIVLKPSAECVPRTGLRERLVLALILGPILEKSFSCRCLLRELRSLLVCLPPVQPLPGCAACLGPRRQPLPYALFATSRCLPVW